MSSIRGTENCRTEIFSKCFRLHVEQKQSVLFSFHKWGLCYPVTFMCVLTKVYVSYTYVILPSSDIKWSRCGISSQLKVTFQHTTQSLTCQTPFPMQSWVIMELMCDTRFWSPARNILPLRSLLKSCRRRTSSSSLFLMVFSKASLLLEDFARFS